MLESGADINFQSAKTGKTPLIIVCSRKIHPKNKFYFQMINFILDSGAKLGIIDKRGRNGLHYTVASGQYNTTKVLLQILKQEGQLSKQINLIDNDGNTPLQIGCNANESKIVGLLIKRGADTSLNDSNQSLFDEIAYDSELGMEIPEEEFLGYGSSSTASTPTLNGEETESGEQGSNSKDSGVEIVYENSTNSNESSRSETLTFKNENSDYDDYFVNANNNNNKNNKKRDKKRKNKNNSNAKNHNSNRHFPQSYKNNRSQKKTYKLRKQSAEKENSKSNGNTHNHKGLKHNELLQSISLLQNQKLSERGMMKMHENEDSNQKSLSTDVIDGTYLNPINLLSLPLLSSDNSLTSSKENDYYHDNSVGTSQGYDTDLSGNSDKNIDLSSSNNIGDIGSMYSLARSTTATNAVSSVAINKQKNLKRNSKLLGVKLEAALMNGTPKKMNNNDKQNDIHHIDNYDEINSKPPNKLPQLRLDVVSSMSGIHSDIGDSSKHRIKMLRKEIYHLKLKLNKRENRILSLENEVITLKTENKNLKRYYKHSGRFSSKNSNRSSTGKSLSTNTGSNSLTASAKSITGASTINTGSSTTTISIIVPNTGITDGSHSQRDRNHRNNRKHQQSHHQHHQHQQQDKQRSFGIPVIMQDGKRQSKKLQIEPSLVRDGGASRSHTELVNSKSSRESRRKAGRSSNHKYKKELSADSAMLYGTRTVECLLVV